MYFLSVPFSRTSMTSGTDRILFPKDLRGMKRQMNNKEDALDNLRNIITLLDSMSHSTCCSEVTWPQWCTVAATTIRSPQRSLRKMHLQTCLTSTTCLWRGGYSRWIWGRDWHRWHREFHVFPSSWTSAVTAQETVVLPTITNCECVLLDAEEG